MQNDAFAFPYTAMAFLAGVVASVVLFAGFKSDVRPVVVVAESVFGWRAGSGWLQEFPFYGLFAVFTVPALFVVHLSDDIDRTLVSGASEDTFGFSVSYTLAAICGILFVVVAGGYLLYAIFQSAAGSFVGAILGLIGLLFMIPKIIAGLLFPLFATIAIATGLICLPRVVMYYLTVHPLRDVSERAVRQGQVPESEMADALSTPPKRAAQEKAMLYDLQKLLHELEETNAELEREREALRGNVREVTERKEAEAKVSERLARIDSLLAENAQYKKRLKELKADE